MRCEGQTVVVSGGGQGIGEEIALRLAAEGADIVVADISAENETTAEDIRSLGRKALAVTTDLRDEESVREMARKTLETFGAVHSVVNNSGIVAPWGISTNFRLKSGTSLLP